MGSSPRRGNTRIEVLFILSLAILGATLSIRLLQDEWIFRDGPGEGPAIGILKEKAATVRRKIANHYAWHFTQREDAFYHRESLQTGSESYAVLKLSRGTLAEIDENSLVVFDGSAENQLRLLEGSLTFSHGDQESRLVIGSDGRLTTSVVSIRGLSPRPDEELFTRVKEKREVTFRWLPRDATLKQGHLELSVESKFNTPISYSIENLLIGTTHQRLGAGHYFWRLRGKTTPLTRSGSFNVTEVSPLALKDLLRDSAGRLRVRWVSPSDLKSAQKGKHQLQVSPTPDFRALELETEILPETLETSLIVAPQSRLFARVHSTFGDLQLDGPTLSESDSVQIAKISSPKNSRTEDSPPPTSEREKNSAESAANRAPAKAGSEMSSGVSDRGDIPEKIAEANLDLRRALLEYEVRDTNLILTWNWFSADPDHWEVWTVDRNGSPQVSLQSGIAGNSRIAALPLSTLSPDQYLMVVGKSPTPVDPSGDALSNIIQYSIAAPRAPDSLKIPAVRLGWQEPPMEAQNQPLTFTQSCKWPQNDTFVVSWIQNQLVQSYLIQIFLGKSSTPAFSYSVEGNQTQAILYPLLFSGDPSAPQDPSIRVELRAVNAAGIKSPPTIAWICLGDLNGDGVVNGLDSDKTNPGPHFVPVRRDSDVPPSPDYLSKNPGDVTWDGFLSIVDRCNVNRFRNQRCLLGN